jgi:hypothetical protein
MWLVAKDAQLISLLQVFDLETGSARIVMNSIRRNPGGVVPKATLTIGSTEIVQGSD